MTIRQAIEDKASQAVDRVMQIQIAPGGIGVHKLLRIIGILFITHLFVWVQSCRVNTESLRQEMARSNQAAPVLESEAKKINAKDKAALKRLTDENATLKDELDKARRARKNILPAGCGSCAIPIDRFPGGMRERTNTTR